MIDIDTGDGNLTIDRLTGGEQLLVAGTLQYLENQGPPSRTLIPFLGQSALTLKGGENGQPWFRFPWAACQRRNRVADPPQSHCRIRDKGPQ